MTVILYVVLIGWLYWVIVSTFVDDGRRPLLRVVAWADALVAIIMTSGVYSELAFEREVEEIRRSGGVYDLHNLFNIQLGIFYFAPNAALWALASLSMWLCWKARWVTQLLAAFWTVVPVIWAEVPSWRPDWPVR